MSDFLVKLHSNKMDSKIRKTETGQLATQGPPPPAGSPPGVRGCPSPGTGKEQGQSSSPKTWPSPAPSSPQPAPPSEDAMPRGLRDC